MIPLQYLSHNKLPYDSSVTTTTPRFLYNAFVTTTSLRFPYNTIVTTNFPLRQLHHDSLTMPSSQLLHYDSFVIIPFVIMSVCTTPGLPTSPPCLPFAARNREAAAGQRLPSGIPVFVWTSFVKRRT